MKIGYLGKSGKELILLASSATRTAGRNCYYFWVNLNSKYILTNLCYNPTVVAEVRYIVSLIASYFADLEVHFSFHS